MNVWVKCAAHSGAWDQVGFHHTTWALSQYKDVFTSMGVSIMKMRCSSDRLIFIMGIPIPARWHFYTEMAPWWLVVQHATVEPEKFSFPQKNEKEMF